MSPSDKFEVTPEFASQFVRDVRPDPLLHAHSDGSGFDPACRECQAKRSAEQVDTSPPPEFVERLDGLRAEIEAAQPKRYPFGSEPGSGHPPVFGDQADIRDHPRGSAQPKRATDWTVLDPYARESHVFVSLRLALSYAAEVARSDRPTIVRCPEPFAPGAPRDLIVMRADPNVTLQAVRALYGPAVAWEGAPEPVGPPESSVQALAGARLFYALYHDMEAVMWLHGRSDRGKVTAFTKAYRAATAAFLLGSESGEDGEPAAAVPTDVALRLVAQGRREAAEAIRSQAHMFYASDPGPEVLAATDTAARLAEGSTGVQGKDPS